MIEALLDAANRSWFEAQHAPAGERRKARDAAETALAVLLAEARGQTIPHQPIQRIGS